VPWWGWLLGCIGMIVFWGLIIWGIWYVVTRALPSHEPAPRGLDARAILDERLARGEIDTDEYTRLRAAITASDVHAGNGRAPASAGDRR
jgi:putative membrane protein